MAPGRHETSGADPPEPPDNTSTHNTRKSKRKASEISNGTNEASSFGKRSSTRSTRKSAAANETSEASVQPPTKRRRSSNAVNSSEPEFQPTPATQPETPEAFVKANSEEDNVASPSNINDIPNITVEAPAEEGSSGETKSDEDNFLSQTPVTWDALPANEEENGEDVTTTQATRGGRGRGRGGARGGRGRKRAGAKPKPKPAPKPVAATRGRRRGGRRKASVNPRIDAHNIRAGELKVHYTALAKLQRHALDVLAERSLKMLMDDETYHESLPEFEEVTDGLREAYEKAIKIHDNKREQEEAQAKRMYEADQKIAHDQCKDQCENVDEAAFARIEEHTMYVWHQYVRGDELDEIPIPKVHDATDGKLYDVTHIPVKQSLHPFATPYTKPQDAVPLPAGEGDTEYLQHPATLWHSLNAKQKNALVKERDLQTKKRREAAVEEEKNRGKPSKKRKREALFQPQQTHVTIDVEGEEEEEDAEDPAGAATTGGANSPEEGDIDSVVSSDAEEYPEDDLGVCVPRKKARRNATTLPNNRIRYQPTFKFKDHEIGLRQHYFKRKTNAEIEKSKRPNEQFTLLGIDASPNREHFYFEQRANGWNTAKMKPEDFDERIVKTHRLHPRFGIPLPKSRNVDRDERKRPYFKASTNWNEDLRMPKSKRVVETFADGHRKLFHSSRSWVQETEQKWAARPAREAMYEVLKASQDYELLNPAEDFRGMDVLASAAQNQAELDKEIEAADKAKAKVDYEKRKARDAAEKQAREAAKTASATQYAGAAAIPAFGTMSMASSSRYDPVRDTTYQTPYPRPVPPPRAQHNVYRQGGPLSALADMADVGNTIPSTAGMSRQRGFLPGPPPPSTRAGPSRSWVEPPDLRSELPPAHMMLPHVHPQPMAMQPQPQLGGPTMTGMAPNNYFMPPHPGPPPQFQSPRGGNQANLRPLQPAPPRGGRRTTPPQSQNRTWYGN
ncbi:uncharacterized protein LY89DRAFT_198691 [Mollisia scopiformis]|uniref:Uncharacterized protein n=1 Tax=Mollisia scopiformis TaxID=149040 RepID=A0A194WYI4_MOLSC|nr:uncharacterized protein LY89DRAFT_198691 [Mollisia scopiformis]KUJ13023.1 hypothetical protein LY89DRAFT_198691 [Mollisia scopiformis]